MCVQFLQDAGKVDDPDHPDYSPNDFIHTWDWLRKWQMNEDIGGAGSEGGEVLDEQEQAGGDLLEIQDGGVVSNGGSFVAGSGSVAGGSPRAGFSSSFVAGSRAGSFVGGSPRAGSPRAGSPRGAGSPRAGSFVTTPPGGGRYNSPPGGRYSPRAGSPRGLPNYDLGFSGEDNMMTDTPAAPAFCGDADDIDMADVGTVAVAPWKAAANSAPSDPWGKGGSRKGGKDAAPSDSWGKGGEGPAPSDSWGKGGKGGKDGKGMKKGMNKDGSATKGGKKGEEKGKGKKGKKFGGGGETGPAPTVPAASDDPFDVPSPSTQVQGAVSKAAGIKAASPSLDLSMDASVDSEGGAFGGLGSSVGPLGAGGAAASSSKKQRNAAAKAKSRKPKKELLDPDRDKPVLCVGTGIGLFHPVPTHTGLSQTCWNRFRFRPVSSTGSVQSMPQSVEFVLIQDLWSSRKWSNVGIVFFFFTPVRFLKSGVAARREEIGRSGEEGQGAGPVVGPGAGRGQRPQHKKTAETILQNGLDCAALC